MNELEKECIDLVNKKIHEYTGINVANSQIAALLNHIEKRASAKGISALEFVRGLQIYTPEFDAVINLVTVNETYFFREEKQFDYLKDVLFPKYVGKNLTIWSSSCATGEEAISLLALALSMNINLTIYASDIDESALKKLSLGTYNDYSLRTDGKKYHKLLETYSIRNNNDLIFKKDFLNRIHTFKFNIIKDEMNKLPFFEDVDIIFLRNVFIYFDMDSKIFVINKLSERLKNKGLLFLSMNEIGSFDDSIVPDFLFKTNHEVVYFFEKNISVKKMTAAEKQAYRLKKMDEERAAVKKQENLKQFVEKSKKQKELEKDKENKSVADKESVIKNITDTFDVKKAFENVCLEINRGDFEKARTLSKAITGTANRKYSLFMQAYVEYHADNRSEAESLFASVESLSPDFWPAFFYHGMILRDFGKKDYALSCFSKCRNLLFSFGSKVPYDFALDSFSPAYIYSLCETFSMQGES
ncbi:MAG: hypothetical protein K5829_12785 [Treponema sp.]|nr:hypothetical protein [Treponema sp.]